MSNFIHDQLKIGDFLELRQPMGDFHIDETKVPVTLISAGVGITPMVSMLRYMAKTQPEREVLFLHGARNSKEFPLSDEIRLIIDDHKHYSQHTVYSDPQPEDKIGIDYDSRGHISANLLAQIWQGPQASYYLCGPSRFLSDMYFALQKLGAPVTHIHQETFN